MNILTVGSSSSGNCTMLYNKDTHILIDCGVSVKKILEKTGRSTFDALFISHEHYDHISSAGPLGRKTGVPIYVHKVIAEVKADLFNDCKLKELDGTVLYKIGSLEIQPFSTKHDAKNSFGFIVTEPATGVKLAYLTDTGSITHLMYERTKDCNAFFIECDYDDELMAAYDGYDDFLKDRITSPVGHLSTQQALEYLSQFDISKLHMVVLGHLSARTNTPDKVKERVMEKFASYKDKFFVAPLEHPKEINGKNSV